MIRHQHPHQSYEDEPSREGDVDIPSEDLAQPERQDSSPKTSDEQKSGEFYDNTLFDTDYHGVYSSFGIPARSNRRHYDRNKVTKSARVALEGFIDPPTPETQTHKDFNIAREGQKDVIVDDTRFLLTPADGLDEYSDILEEAGVGMLEWNSSPIQGMALLEIPRDARTLEQVVTSVESQPGQRENIFYKLGKSMSAIAERTGKLPYSGDIGLGHILYSKLEDSIVLTPPVSFIAYNQKGVQSLEEEVHTQTVYPYKNFGGDKLYAAFEEGIK